MHRAVMSDSLTSACNNHTDMIQVVTVTYHFVMSTYHHGDMVVKYHHSDMVVKYHHGDMVVNVMYHSIIRVNNCTDWLSW
jgi:hypothetical protein